MSTASPHNRSDRRHPTGARAPVGSAYSHPLCFADGGEPEPLEIFRAGTHRTAAGEDVTFSAADVAAIAGSYDPTRHEAPIVVGHPKDNAPAYGWVKALRADPETGALLAVPDQVDQSFAELVRAGRFKKISASFYPAGHPGNPTPDRPYLRHVGFLGAQPPAVKGLRPVSLSDSEQDLVTITRKPAAQQGALDRVLPGLRELFGSRDYMEDDAPKGQAGEVTGPAARSELDRLQEAGMTLVEISEALARMGEEAARSPGVLAQIRDGEIANPPESLIEFLRRVEPPRRDTQDNAEGTPMSDEERRRLAELERENREAKAKLDEFAEAQAKARRADNKAFVEGLVKAGKLAPGVKDDVLAFMDALEPEEALEFAEGKKLAPLAFFRNLLEQGGAVIDLSERAGGGAEAKPQRLADRVKARYAAAAN